MNIETVEKLKLVALVIYYAAWFLVFLFIAYLTYEAMRFGV
jgi:hypothetical protein